MRLATRCFALTLLLPGVWMQAHGSEGQEDRPARSILIRESTSAGNENAELRQLYDQTLTRKLAALSKWLVRTEPPAGTVFSEEERENQFKMLGIEYYLTTSMGVDRRERVAGGLELVIVVRLYRYPSGLIWKDAFIGVPSDIESFADDVATNVYSWLGPV